MSKKEIPPDVRIRLVIMIMCGFVMIVLVARCMNKDNDTQPESGKDRWDSLTIEQQSNIANDLYKEWMRKR